ncbi:hypothetical protein ASG35_15535 [Burkholderia sp. Leaf177]|uniref:hypothetical protein n=1 Tax=Burkholderia sp. Leaf177 TaxID=1736287 RepID=UPI0006FEA928|nr:hypothetical protein [Burkholderia sp. Leaf177]KQR76466.1 hypothetical protein ASG35_15535 [Burkholderia sp. Leaf177]
MNLTDQLGALESSLDELILAAASPSPSVSVAPEAGSVADSAADSAADAVAAVADPAPAPDAKPTLNVSRPEQNVIEMNIGGKSVALSPEGVSQLIEELSNARASMTVDQPKELPPGWRYVATKNPVMATQRYPNGDRLLVLRHTGHGWVPFSFSPDMVIELYAMLTQR